MPFVNLTPHEIVIARPFADTLTIPPSGLVARVITDEVASGWLCGVHTFRLVQTGIEGLPEPVEGTIYIASAMVAAAVRRTDVVSPGDLRRDDKGRVIGCAALVRHAL